MMRILITSFAYLTITCVCAAQLNPFGGSFSSPHGVKREIGINLFEDKRFLVEMDESEAVSLAKGATDTFHQLRAWTIMSYVYSPGQYAYLLSKMGDVEKAGRKEVLAAFAGSLVGAPLESTYDQFLRDRVTSAVQNTYSSQCSLYDPSALVLGLRKTEENRKFLERVASDAQEGIAGALIRDALDFWNLQPAQIDTSKCQSVNPDELQIIKAIFSRGVPGVHLVGQSAELNLYDLKLNGHWVKRRTRWEFLPGSNSSSQNVEEIELSYDFVFDESRDKAFVSLRVWKANLSWATFTFRIYRIGAEYRITGLWFDAIS